MGDEKRNIVEPSILAGFMELLPEDQMLFNDMLDTIKKTYESFGFIPLDTPVIEKSEVLLAKSGGDTAKQVYRFNKGDNDLSLRFDLTVPLARYVAQHYGELTFPFRRYHIAKVYRGEKPQKGRFREFYQCDIDIIGNGSLNIINDAEIVSVIYSTFKALGFGDFTIMINNRKLLNGFFRSYNVTDALEVLRIVDKIDKAGAEYVKEELGKMGLGADAIDAIMNLVGMSGSPLDIVAKLKEFDIADEDFKTGIDELEAVCSSIKALGVPDENFKLNLKIARGLDYYTGTVYETFLNDYPELGSVCSGGRYDELASNYTKQSLPGVGISIGFSRLFYQLKAAGIISNNGKATPSKIMLVPMDGTLDFTLSAASKLRAQGINTEVYLNSGKMGKKFTYANKLGIPYVGVIGDEEMAQNSVMLKDMVTGEQKLVAVENISSEINA